MTHPSIAQVYFRHKDADTQTAASLGEPFLFVALMGKGSSKMVEKLEFVQFLTATNQNLGCLPNGLKRIRSYIANSGIVRSQTLRDDFSQYPGVHMELTFSGIDIEGFPAMANLGNASTHLNNSEVLPYVRSERFRSSFEIRQSAGSHACFQKLLKGLFLHALLDNRLLSFWLRHDIKAEINIVLHELVCLRSHNSCKVFRKTVEANVHLQL